MRLIFDFDIAVLFGDSVICWCLWIEKESFTCIILIDWVLEDDFPSRFSLSVLVILFCLVFILSFVKG